MPKAEDILKSLPKETQELAETLNKEIGELRHNLELGGVALIQASFALSEMNFARASTVLTYAGFPHLAELILKYHEENKDKVATLGKAVAQATGQTTEEFSSDVADARISDVNDILKRFKDV